MYLPLGPLSLLRLLQFPLSLLNRSYVVTGIAAAVIGVAWQLSGQHLNLGAFPTVGSSGWLGSWWAGIKFITSGNTEDVIREGYQKYNGAPFKIATLYHWVVVVTSRAQVEELRNAREDELSFMEAANEDFNFAFTMGSEHYNDPYHIPVMRSQFPRKIGVLYPELRDEIITAFDDNLNLNGNEWKSVPALTTMRQIVCRASNRSFVGLPLCRDPGYLALNIKFGIDLITGGLTIGFFPKFLKSLAAHLVTTVPKLIRRNVTYLGPIIKERQEHMNEYGANWAEKPNDLLSWLMDEVPDANVESLTRKVLVANFAANFSSANVFTNALYNLAANPQYVQPLREEVEATVENNGWSRSSLSKMHKVDSFLKETMRIEGVNTLGLSRKALKDFTFSDGTFIPKGARIQVGMTALHHDNTLYENPEVFDPFRFAKMGEKDGESVKHQFAATSPEYLPFGRGRHVCPGRFLAAATLKTMLAHVVTTYDIKPEENKNRPQSLRIGTAIVADSKAKVMFRKRARYAGAP